MKKRIVILFGGKSGEHEVTIVSAKGIFNALDRSKFEVRLVGVDRTGKWLLPDETKLLLQSSNPKLNSLQSTGKEVAMIPSRGSEIVSLTAKGIEDSKGFACDVVIPIIHGTNGEDGTLQGLLEMAQVPYVGSGVLGSALCMDKEMAKRVLRDAGIPVVPFFVARAHLIHRDMNEWINRAETDFGYPYFVKPSNMGSSVGVSKVKNRDEAQGKIGNAFLYDTKVLIEQGISARELECAVLGNEEPRASIIGEVVPLHDFYSYDAKYVDADGADLHIPAKDLQKDEIQNLQSLAIKAFQVLECSGMARVDFFMDKKSRNIYLNELNTIPGFTPISMYPKLWEATGIPYSELLTQLVELAVERFSAKARLKTSV